jgi:hypothetical protein
MSHAVREIKSLATAKRDHKTSQRCWVQGKEMEMSLDPYLQNKHFKYMILE